MKKLLASAIAVTALAGSAFALAPAATAAPSDTYLITCTGNKVIKPSSFTLGCVDASTTLTNLKWTSWDSNGARGTGTLAWNTCLPETCAAGKVLKYKVKVRLGGLASAPGLETWSKMYVTFNDLGPAGLETGTYTIDNTAS